jgi:hypothetical protein
VGTPRLRSSVESSSLFSTETVPTSTGWPFGVALDDVLDDRGELRLLGAVDEVGLVDARIIGMFVGIGTTPSL